MTRVETSKGTDTSPRDALSREAESLRKRVAEPRDMRSTFEAMDDVSLLAELRSVRPLIDYVAAHSHAEEHVIYPYMERECASELPSLREDHVALDTLSHEIHDWRPSSSTRDSLSRLLTDFCELALSHLEVEAELCLPVVRDHVRGAAEQVLFEAVETDVFDHAAGERLHLAHEHGMHWQAPGTTVRGGGGHGVAP